jgi:hypothetical protein
MKIEPFSLLDAVLKDTAPHIAHGGNPQDRPKGLAPRPLHRFSQPQQINVLLKS